ncbi:S-adenosyl-L-methionine-dependent methyltransferase [Suillus paluster]|uniref:S-adenosyl-L-methionine-dependent methyltransferase n=1 Tax=Suillus paluster TaxID=48578 RepID=UPI001B881639|nr:S-adenosyl-L-methionine-dependent methyltransferase [Suillus paluster]KAG1756702.1 S-adenosyl-L-methionine-dependent methyltransferase [Suillus paluster]
MRLNYPVIFPLNQLTYVGEDDSEFFCQIHGRRFNALSTRYMLPAADEEERSELQHKTIQFLFNGKNYVGPVADTLKPREGQERCRVLDLGTGGGFWAIDLADEFPSAEVIGVDLAPVQPREVPANCTFELCDLDQWYLPYPSEHFDVIHARFMHTGNYSRFLHEIARMLRPGGLVILIEPDTEPIADEKTASQITRSGQPSGMRGWFTLWETYRRCLRDKGIDYPVALSIGQLAWMNYDMMLPAMKPLFLSAGMRDWEAKKLIEEAHQDLYYPLVRASTRLHIVHATKKAKHL